jgi:FixJ family two-component response regulator
LLVLNRKLQDGLQKGDESYADLQSFLLSSKRYFEVACHELRQPLQALSLLQDLLSQVVVGEVATQLLERMDQALTTVGDILDTIPDNEQLGAVSNQVLESPELIATYLSLLNNDSSVKSATIFVVDDNEQVRSAIRSVLEERGHIVEDFATCESFLATYRPGHDACLLIDADLPGMNGFGLIQALQDNGHALPFVMITGHSDVQMAVRAMKAGALDFIEKPVGRLELLVGIERAFEQSRDRGKISARRENAGKLVSSLTNRQRQIMNLVLAGQPSKNIAADLGISQRTVETHRADIMKKTGSKSLPALARLALAADQS